MVLVDTSVWIRFLSGRKPYADDLSKLLAEEQVAGHDLIYGELLTGDSGARARFLEAYNRIHRAPVIGHADVVLFVRERALGGRGVGWIDANLLASAIVGRFQIWTADARLAAVANELGIAF